MIKYIMCTLLKKLAIYRNDGIFMYLKLTQEK